MDDAPLRPVTGPVGSDHPQRLHVVVPPGWARVPLTSEEASTRAVAQVVATSGLDDGEGARLRRELQDQLEGAARSAREAGATTLLLTTVHALPVSAALVVTPLPPRVSVAGDEPWLVGARSRVDTARLPAGPVVRRVRETSTGEPPVTSLVVDYWLTAPDGDLVHLAVSTPLAAHREAMVGLFDAILETARWS